ncbi:hypothetical protein [Wolbachia endosymbiont (group A) of Cheilosia soror]|uniref:hypothetical protein n=1 Tax=Wolbachia endosymbiont (group A) of Cheilosia soror TaxID=2953995 RepID=UPI0021F81EAA|nr:hypothetical protein [Wolbachia endosymbiont (group A) of Cheilosia soror]
MELKIRKFPCPKKLPENVLSIDLGKSVGFAYVKDNTLYCGSYVLNVEEWRFNPPTLRQISSEYKGIIDALLYENKDINLVLLEDNSYFFKQRYIRGSHMSYYKKLQMVVEGLFCLHWRGEVKRYFGGSLKKKHFGTARKEIVKERIKKMLDVSGMNDHMTDGIAGLFASLKREE